MVIIVSAVARMSVEHVARGSNPPFHPKIFDMYYIVQENVFRETNYDNLIKALDRLGFPYEIVKVLPFTDELEVKTQRKDVFPFGSLKMARISTNLGWKPGSQMNNNHDFMVYKEYYRENLLNWDSRIIRFGDTSFFNKEVFFARPTKDTKVFTGKVFDMETWEAFRQQALTNGHTTILDENTEVQICSVKKISQEIRFWIVKGNIVTASQYRLGNRVVLNENVDEAAYEFCRKMIGLFQLNDAFVMDVCLVNGEYKIVECGCINCAGFYNANMQKLIVAIEEMMV